MNPSNVAKYKDIKIPRLKITKITHKQQIKMAITLSVKQQRKRRNILMAYKIPSSDKLMLIDILFMPNKPIDISIDFNTPHMIYVSGNRR